MRRWREFAAGTCDTLDLRDTGLIDADAVAKIAELPQLRHLLLDYTSFADDDVDRLPQNLSTLSLSHTKVTDTGMRGLRRLKSLCFLRLDGLPISDVGMKEVGRLGSLRNLSLYRCRVGDQGLAELEELRDLVLLSLDATDVTSKGVRRSLPKLPKLRYASMWDTEIDIPCVKHLNIVRPELAVNR